jgi:hypothetical protein
LGLGEPTTHWHTKQQPAQLTAGLLTIESGILWTLFWTLHHCQSGSMPQDLNKGITSKCTPQSPLKKHALEVSLGLAEPQKKVCKLLKKKDSKQNVQELISAADNLLISAYHAASLLSAYLSTTNALPACPFQDRI